MTVLANQSIAERSPSNPNHLQNRYLFNTNLKREKRQRHIQLPFTPSKETLPKSIYMAQAMTIIQS